ncbi:hypothetical protein MTO96_005272 [Rhipicephalus appendiculatus]
MAVRRATDSFGRRAAKLLFTFFTKCAAALALRELVLLALIIKSTGRSDDRREAGSSDERASGTDGASSLPSELLLFVPTPAYVAWRGRRKQQKKERKQERAPQKLRVASNASVAADGL